jgi:hypothetical protein
MTRFFFLAALSENHIAFLDQAVFKIQLRRFFKMAVLAMEKVENEDLNLENLSNRIDQLGEEIAAKIEFKTVFNEYLVLQQKILTAGNPKRTEPLLFRLDGVVDKELATVERFFYQAGFSDAIRAISLI